jgi:hypothetical protein
MEGAVVAVEVLVERCAGLDVGKADLKACIRVPGPRGGRRQQIKMNLPQNRGGMHYEE